MDAQIAQALRRGHTIDITTTGRKSGLPRRIEIWFHSFDGRVFITGRPGTRSWYANLLANPDFTFHLKASVKADLPAKARPVLDAPERREILKHITRKLGREANLDEWVSDSPLIEVLFLA